MTHQRFSLRCAVFYVTGITEFLCLRLDNTLFAIALICNFDATNRNGE